MVGIKRSRLIKKQSEDKSRRIRTSRKQQTIGRTIGVETLQRKINYYRWWFQYLRLALELESLDVEFIEHEYRKNKFFNNLFHKVKVKRGIYSDWDLGSVQNLTFDKWWISHKHLFVESETVEIKKSDEVVFDGNSRYFKIDARKGTNDTIKELRSLLGEQKQDKRIKSSSKWKINGSMDDEVLFNVYNFMIMRYLQDKNATQIFSNTDYFKNVRKGMIGLAYDDQGNVDYQRNVERSRDYRSKGHRLILTVCDGNFVKHGENKVFFERGKKRKL